MTAATHRPARRSLVWAAAALLGLAGSAGAQTADALAAACTVQGGLPAPCAASAVAARALHGHLALLAGFGSEVSGTATTLGTRVQGGPRLSFAARLGAVDVDLPDLSDPAGSRETGSVVPAFHAEASVGLFDGVRLMPTVGGFLSLDVFGRAAFILLPESEGFDGGTTAYTLGLRAGVFREGFTVPGVSASVSRRFVGNVGWGREDDPSVVVVDPGVTSIRATVGKDLFAVEWMAGFGWDDIDGDATVRAADGVGGSASVTSSVDASRTLWFVGASMTFGIVLNVAVEAGWADGHDPVAAYAGDFDPGAGTAFASFAARFVL